MTTAENETPASDAELHLVLASCLQVIRMLNVTVAPRLVPKELVEAEKRLAAGAMLTAIINYGPGGVIEASLAVCGPTPTDNRILFKSVCPIASLAAFVEREPVIEPGRLH